MYISNKVFYHPDRFLTTEVQPVTAEIHITNKCNAKCYYCSSNCKDSQEMSLSMIKQSMKFIASIGCKAVYFSGGGEPAASEHFDHAVDWAHDCGLETGLITNGIISKSWDKMKWVRISIDAADVETYKKIKGVDKFDNVIDNIRESSNYYSTIGVQVVVNKFNEEKLNDIVFKLLELPVNYVNVRPIEGMHREVYSYKTIESVMQLQNLERVIVSEKWFTERNYKTCHASEFVLTIDPRGNVYQCCHVIGNTKYKICNIYEDYFYGRKELFHRIPNKGYDPKVCWEKCRGFNINNSIEAYNREPHKNFL
jgi:radical SAM protein with 4Fe4S-binding SPASM domain